MRLNKGFTIIELLIVIVIIGILVAITAVSYTGLTNQAKAAQAKSNARNVKQVALACYAKEGAYPTVSTANLNTCADGASIPTTITVSGTAPNAANGTYTVRLVVNSSTGNADVYYWDYSASTPASTLL